MTQNSEPNVPPEALAERVKSFAGSQMFRKTFQEGMALVEETAAYLDGPGRAQSQELPRRAALTYAGESMRLTTRLMQVASWLLVQRAIQEGEMTVAEAAKEKYRLGAREICRATKPDAREILPERLVQLLSRSETLYERVERLDQVIYRGEGAPTESVMSQLDRLRSAFNIEDEGT